MTKAATPIPKFDASGLTALGGAPRRDDRAEGIQLPEAIDGFAYDPRATRAVNKRRALRLIREQSARAVLDRLPDPGEDIILVMTGRYHGLDLIEAMLSLAECPAAECYLATLGTNKANIDVLAELIDAGKIGRLTMLVADVFAAKDVAEFAYLQATMDARSQRVAVSRNHAKLILLKLTDGRHIVAHGSLNLRRCNAFEQFALCQDPDLYEFFRQFIEDVIGGEVVA